MRLRATRLLRFAGLRAGPPARLAARRAATLRAAALRAAVRFTAARLATVRLGFDGRTTFAFLAAILAIDRSFSPTDASPAPDDLLCEPGASKMEDDI